MLRLVHTFSKINLPLLALVLIAGCRAKPTEEQISQGSREDLSQGCGAKLFQEAPESVPTPSAESSTLVFQLTQTDIDPCTVNGYVVGDDKDKLKMQRGEQGVFYIPDVPEGDYDIIIQAESTGQAHASNGNIQSPQQIGGAHLSLLEGPKKVGYRLSSIKSVPGQIVKLPETALLPVGSFAGKATLEGQSNHNGILVYVPGTHWLAYTGEDGSYKIPDVVAGSHGLVFSHDQFHPQAIDKIAIIASKETQVNPITLLVNKGQLNEIQLTELEIDKSVGAHVSHDTKVKFRVALTGNPVKVSVSEISGCANRPWNPVSSAETYAFNGTFEFSVTDYLKKNGAELVNLYICAADKDNTVSVLNRRLYLDLIGNLGANQIQIPETLNPYFLEMKPKILSHLDSIRLDLFYVDDLLDEIKALEKPEKYHFQSKEIKPGFLTYNFAENGIKCGSDYWFYAQLSRDFVDGYKTVHKIQSKLSRQKLAYHCWIDMAEQGRPENTVLRDSELPKRTNAGIHAVTPKVIWAGDRLFFWGGIPPSQNSEVRYSASYNPGDLKWNSVSKTNAPAPRYDHEMIWTGNSVIVFGGFNATAHQLYDGGIYSPESDRWSKIPNWPDPLQSTGRRFFIVRWLGDRLIVLDPNDLEQGFVFYPGASQWIPVSKIGIPEPFHRIEQPSALWTGTKLVLWGGWNSLRVPDTHGAIYDPIIDLWQTFDSSGILPGRTRGGSVVVGSSVAYIGGKDALQDPIADAALFDPLTRTWEKLPDAPQVLDLASSISSTAKGFSLSGFARGRDYFLYHYDLASNTWSTDQYGGTNGCTDKTPETAAGTELPATASPLQIVILPNFCGKLQYAIAESAWNNTPYPPLYAYTAIPDTNEISDIVQLDSIGEDRFFVYEMAGTKDRIGKTPAYIGYSRFQALNLAWLKINDGNTNIVSTARTSGLGMRLVAEGHQLHNVKLTIKNLPEGLNAIKGEIIIPKILGGETLDIKAVDGFQLAVDDDSSLLGQHDLTIAYNSDEGLSGSIKAVINVRNAPRPLLTVGDPSTPRLDGNYRFSPGSRDIPFSIPFTNKGPLAARDVTIESTDNCITFSPTFVDIIDGSVTKEVPFSLQVNAGCAIGPHSTEMAIKYYDSRTGTAYSHSLTTTILIGNVATSTVEVSDLTGYNLTRGSSYSFSKMLNMPTKFLGIDSVKVEVHLSHNWCSYLNLSLSKPLPSGSVHKAILTNNSTVCNYDLGRIDYTFDSTQSSNLRPFETIENFDSTGAWTFEVGYDYGDGLGTFESIKLIISGLAVQ